ncbi:MAG: 3-isopropylmalate dehydrogenase [Ectothiorhodospiraceae bacterium]|nr:3-isopropylmalate dehydrogenase [Ectothiorhodospiraceae bacterium]
MSKYEILVMPGEGVGPEIVEQGVAVLEAIDEIFGWGLEITEYEVGNAAFKKTGHHLPPDAKAACDRLKGSSNAAILFGAVTAEPISILRKNYDLFANLRPIRSTAALSDISPLKPTLQRELDMLIVRELTSGIYYGKMESGKDEHGRWASQAMYYHEDEVRRIAKVALQAAEKSRRHLTLVHKGNVIWEVFDIWKDILNEEAKSFPSVKCDDILVDNMAMQMIINPGEFDVALCSNLFGDILSDLGAGLVGSIGVMPSVSMNEAGFALYESIGGTAPTLAGKQKANPIATILSVAMMCRQTLNSELAATMIEEAVDSVLKHYRTEDIANDNLPVISTSEMGKKIVGDIYQAKNVVGLDKVAV